MVIDDFIKYVKEIDRRLKVLETNAQIIGLKFPSDGYLILPNVTTDPVAPSDGQMWFNTVDDVAKIDPFFLKAGMYDDLPPAPLIVSKVGANAPTLAVFKNNIQQYTFDATNDEVFGSTEIVHSYKEGSDIEVHLHWATNGLEGTDKAVKWELEYSVCNGDGSAPFGFAFPTSTVISADTTIPANTPDRSHIITTLGNIVGTNFKVGAYIVWRLRRIASAGTAPTADPFGIAIGFHTLHDSIGSRTVYAK